MGNLAMGTREQSKKIVGNKGTSNRLGNRENKHKKLQDHTFLGRGLSTEGNLRLPIDWASFIARSKFTFFACFSLY